MHVLHLDYIVIRFKINHLIDLFNTEVKSLKKYSNFKILISMVVVIYYMIITKYIIEASSF